MQTIGVIGAGQMGSGIAQVSAQAGYRTLLADISLELAEKGKAGIAKQLARAVEKGKLSAEDSAAALARIEPVSDYAAFAPCDLVIEAATEREDIKRTIFSALGAHLSGTAILASNTSSIPITRLAQAAPDAARFIGVHFFNPVPVMGLIELIRGLATAEATVAAVEAFGRSLGKDIVHANDAPGFIVNRILMPMLNEACFALGEGVATIPDIDTACRLGLNHPMGPLTLADFIGLDTCLEIARVLFTTTGDPKFRPAPLLVKYVEAGWLGKKVGRGFYDWTGPEPVPHPLIGVNLRFTNVCHLADRGPPIIKGQSMAISSDYTRPVYVNGYACRNCADVSRAERNVDPKDPTGGAFPEKKVTAAADSAASDNHFSELARDPYALKAEHEKAVRRIGLYAADFGAPTAGRFVDIKG